MMHSLLENIKAIGLCILIIGGIIVDSYRSDHTFLFKCAHYSHLKR